MKYKAIDEMKYQTTSTFRMMTGIIPPKSIVTDYINLSLAGELLIKKGFQWDGATGAFDTKDFMRGSMVHDAWCRLIEEGHLPQSYRKPADKLLRRMLIEDGMSTIRAWWVYNAIRFYVNAAY